MKNICFSSKNICTHSLCLGHLGRIGGIHGGQRRRQLEYFPQHEVGAQVEVHARAQNLANNNLIMCLSISVAWCRLLPTLQNQSYCSFLYQESRWSTSCPNLTFSPGGSPSSTPRRMSRKLDLERSNIFMCTSKYFCRRTSAPYGPSCSWTWCCQWPAASESRSACRGPRAQTPGKYKLTQTPKLWGQPGNLKKRTLIQFKYLVVIVSEL